VAAFLLTAFAPSYGGEGLWSVGVRSEGFIDLEPGQDWVIGPEIGYSDFNLAAHRLQFKAAYLTSRLEQSFRQNLLRQDYFLLSPVWHFGRNRLFDPTVQLDLGYWRYDVESDLFRDLDNDSWVAAAQVGFALNLFQGEFGLFYHLGYNFITPDSGLIYPGVFGLGFWVML
jgi:hypothetical protein